MLPKIVFKASGCFVFATIFATTVVENIHGIGRLPGIDEGVEA